jgi:hypothetical protein
VISSFFVEDYLNGNGVMLEILLRRIKLLLRFGLIRTVHISLDRLFLGILFRIYEFDAWHANSPLSARPYRLTVARIVNELKPTTVVEVGCGLGGIISNINAEKRYGYDIDVGVIRASRFLHSNDITFIHGDLSVVSLKQIDVLVLVNWIHDISPQMLEGLITPLLSRTHYLLLDAIDSDGPTGYKYKHDFAFLRKRARILSITRHSEEGRSFQLFEVVV